MAPEQASSVNDSDQSAQPGGVPPTQNPADVSVDGQQSDDVIETHDEMPVQASGAAPGVDSVSDEPEVAFSWQASEFVHHHKSPMWYAGLFGVVIVLVIIAVLLQLYLEVALFLVMGVAVMVYARKPPRVMQYDLSSAGVQIDGKLYAFAEFRSFGVISEPEWHSIDLEPAKRFNPRLVLLFSQDDYDEIVGHLQRHLPRMDRQPDLIERVTRYLRF